MSERDAMDSKDDLLVAEYVLGVLPHEERIVLTRRLEVEGGLRDRLAFWEDRLDAMAQDKKVKRGQLAFILARGIGESFIARGVEAGDVRHYLESALTRTA